MRSPWRAWARADMCPTVAFAAQPDVQPGEIEIADAQIRKLVAHAPRSVEKQQEDAIAARVATAGRKPVKQGLDVAAFEKAGLRWRHALHGDPCHLRTDGQTLGCAPSEITRKG